MFTQKQFEYLARCQWQDDWHVSYFVTVVKNYHAKPPNEFVKATRLDQVEFDELMAILLRADEEDIWHLQHALNELSQINHRLFEP